MDDTYNTHTDRYLHFSSHHPTYVKRGLVKCEACQIRGVCHQFNIRVAFRSGCSLRSVLTRVKDPLPPDLQSKVIYKVPCSCGKAYIGETTRRLETRLREHKDACRKQLTDKSAIAEHAWNSHCPIKWEEASVLDHARNSPDLMIKEAIHIQTTPMDRLINRDKGAEIPGCWVATINALAQKWL